MTVSAAADCGRRPAGLLGAFKAENFTTSPIVKAWWSRQSLSSNDVDIFNTSGGGGERGSASEATTGGLPYRSSIRGEPTTVPGCPNWWHDPWDNPDGIRTLLLRGIPAAMASLDIVVGWCALYGDVASIDLKPPAPLSAERDPLASPPATFAVVMYYKESHALRALRHIEHDVFSRINVRISARPFPTVHPDALHRPASSTLVITGTGHVGLQELVNAVNVDVLKVQGVFLTTTRRPPPTVAAASPADSELCIVLQFDDCRMAATVHENLCEQSKLRQSGNGPLRAYFWDEAGVAWPVAEPKICNGLQSAAGPSWLASKAVQRPPTSAINASCSMSQDNRGNASPAGSCQSIWSGQPLWTPAAVVAPPPAAPTTESVPVQAAPAAMTVAAADAGSTPQPSTPAAAAVTPGTPSNDGYAVVARRASPARSGTKASAAANNNASSTPASPEHATVGTLLSSTEHFNTIMIKNIPNKYTPRMILDLLNETHFGRYTTFYLPIDSRNVCNMGYFFLDLVDARVDLPPLIERFQGKRWPHFNSLKTADIAIATLQGRDALLAQVSNSSPLQGASQSRRQWTTRAFNPYRPRLFHTSGPLKGTEIPWFTVTPEEARTGSVLELRPGKPVDPAVANDLMIADVCPAILHGSCPRDGRGKLGTYSDASTPF